MTTRREFLKISTAVGGGLAVGIPLSGAQNASPEINAWVVVRPDERVIIRYARSEMGQGSMTSAAQLVAEELECGWDKVRVEYADTNAQLRRKRPWGDMAAVGSRTIRQSQQALRTAGAAARSMLIAAAAQNWGVPASECSAADGLVTHGPTRRKASFGSVASAAARLEAPKEVTLKEPKDWTVIGKPIPRVEIPDIVQGQIRYGVDAQLPGMVYAAIAQCPVFGGKLRSVDAAKIEKRRGVLKVLPMEDWVAVVADNWWRAKEALLALPVQWDFGDAAGVSSASIEQFLRAGLDDPSRFVTAKREGDVQKALAGAKLIEAEYFTPYLAHATLEPQHCTALIKEGRLDVWVSTQNAEATHAAAAAVSGVPLENVFVHRTQLGGGFGRRGAQDYTRQGVAIAKAMEGTPVKLLWTREEDMQHDNYRPVSLVRFRAALDASGNPVAWYSRVAAPSIIATLLRMSLREGIDPQAVAAFADQPYAIPNVAIEYAQRNPHVPVGFWRTVGHSQNPYMRECFIDELAHAAGKDPYEYRLGLLSASSKEFSILKTTAEKANWVAPLPAGVHRGIAVTEAYGSYTAVVAELAVSDKGMVDIKRLVLGIDSGYVVNPDNVTAQMQGSAVFMLTAMFWGEITIKDGRVEQSNFHDHRMMRLREMPRVEVVIAPTGGFWGGIGEPGQASIAPAVCNAIFSATGKRVRSLPLKNQGFDLA